MLRRIPYQSRAFLEGTRRFLNIKLPGDLKLFPLSTMACPRHKQNVNQGEDAHNRDETWGKKMKVETPVTVGHPSASTGQPNPHNRPTVLQTPTVPLTLYRRPLPESSVALTSEEGKNIFKEAMTTGHMNCYFKLSAQFRTQDEPAYCGLSTLIMVLNALEIDPGRIWKGPWKWYHEDMLDCCVPTEVIRKQGITFDEFICLAECNSMDLQAVRVDDSCSEEEFRALVKEMTLREDSFLVASYSRPAMDQSGDGHFATVSGYHPGKDMILILDTARFKYPPHWVSLSRLFAAMKVLDASTGLSRGYIKMWRSEESKALVLFKMTPLLSVNAEPAVVENLNQFVAAWEQLLSQMFPSEGESALKEDGKSLKDGHSLARLVDEILHGLVLVSASLGKEAFILTVQEHIKCSSACNVQCVIQDLLCQLENTQVFKETCEKVCRMTLEDVSELKKVFGAWQSLQPSEIGMNDERDGSTSGCVIEQSLCLCHFVTAFLLSWPYPAYCVPGSLSSALASLSRDVFQGSGGQLLKDEMSTLHRQLSKLTVYHSPPVGTKLKVTCPVEKKCKKSHACCIGKQF